MSLPYEYKIEYIIRYNRMTSAKIEDFDADGRPDVVVGDATNLAVDIWEHNPAKQGFDRIARAEGFDYEIHDATLADVDGDGDKDMIAGLRFSGVQVALNKGNDTFAAPYSVDTRYTWRVIAEDMTGDGKVDIVQAPDFGFIKVLMGNGRGWFAEAASPTQVISGSNAKNVTAIDVDGDGDLDLMSLESDETNNRGVLSVNKFVVTPGVGYGVTVNIAASALATEASQVRAGPAAADFNGDGVPDFVTGVGGWSDGAPTSSTLVLYESVQGRLEWQMRVLDQYPTPALTVVAGDVNDDGRPDIVVAGGDFSGWLKGLHVYTNIGDGAFEEDVLFPDLKFSATNGLAIGDVNGDGRTDIVTKLNESDITQAPGWLIVLTANDAQTPREIIGTPGNDVIWGTPAAELIRGLDGDDTLHALGGDDYVTGDAGDDALYGGAGDDKLYGGSGRDVVRGGDGSDWIKGEGGDDVIHGDAGNDVLIGEAGKDKLYGGSGNDYVSGGDDSDWIKGEQGDDTLFGDAGYDSMFGGDGRDTLYGGAGGDTLYGDADNDRIFGNDGDDTAFGGAGDDEIKGADGNDGLNGQDGADVIHGDAGNDVLIGEAGKDKLYGGSGDDYITGGADADWIKGEQGDDVLLGDAGKDIIFGGDGRDTLIGGMGIDTLDGGADADIFTFNAVWESTAASRDGIVAFDLPGAAFGDRIDVSGIDANALVAGHQAFTFGSTGIGGLWLENVGSETLVFGNVEGDATAELAIRITDGLVLASAYTADDFIFAV